MIGVSDDAGGGVRELGGFDVGEGTGELRTGAGSGVRE